jgi:hypothetical protein
MWPSYDVRHGWRELGMMCDTGTSGAMLDQRCLCRSAQNRKSKAPCPAQAAASWRCFYLHGCRWESYRGPCCVHCWYVTSMCSLAVECVLLHGPCCVHRWYVASMRIYVCILYRYYMYVCTCTCTCTCVYMYTHTYNTNCTCTFMHMYACTHIHAYVCMYMYDDVTHACDDVTQRKFPTSPWR